MTAIKVRQERKIILDFSDYQYSRGHIRKVLQKIEIKNHYENSSYISIISNYIKIGMYTIRLWLPADSSPNWNKLKDYHDFEVSIYENKNSGEFKIELSKDERFNNQYWTKYNFFGKLRIKHLLDIIMYCQRLDQLRAFL